MLRKLLAAVVGALLLGVSSPGISALGSATANPWTIGDVFLGIGDTTTFFGVYRGFQPDGTRKTDPDLLDAVGQWTTGCAVDPTVSGGDLYTTSFSSTLSRIPDALPHAPAVGIQFFGKGGNRLLPLGPGVSELPANAGSWLFESVTFDNAGNTYLGAQIPPVDATSWTGYGWIVKLSKPTSTAPATILGWWQVDAGVDTNPTKNPAISQDIHGVDWLDLSKDQTTIYYTSEDDWIRSFHVAAGADANRVPFDAGTQGPKIQVHAANTSTGVGGKVYAIRIISPGDPANGFLVATPAMVYRVDATGAIIRGYFDPAETGYFALNVTPDGGSFWTATLNGHLYRFHIGSGAMSGPFATGATGALGLCVKREYTASQNVCFATDPGGNPVPSSSDPSGYQTVPCTLPPLPSFCAAKPTDPSCEAPGTPTFVQPPDLDNYEGDAVTVQLTAHDPWGQPLTWSIQNLPMGMDASYQPQPLQVSTTGLISGTLAIHDSAQSPYRVRVIVTTTHGQSASAEFSWTIKTRGANAPPTLTYSGGMQSLTDGFTLAAPITLQAGDLDLDTLVVSATYTRYTDGTFSQPMSGSPQQGPLPGLSFPTNIGGSVNPTWLVPITGAPQIAGPPFPQYYGLTITVYDDNGSYDHKDPVLYQRHHVSATVPIVINNLPPTFSVADQVTLLNAVVSYTGMKTSAVDPDGVDPSNVTFALAPGSGPLPGGLRLAGDGTVSGAATQEGTFPIAVRATDVYGAFTDHAFTWLVTRSEPVCTNAVASVTAIWPPDHKLVPIDVLGVYDRDPRTPFTIRIDRILQDEPTNSVGDGNTQVDGRVDGSTAWVRAERIGTPSAPGNGRVYEIQFTAIDRNGATCSGRVVTGVPHDQRPGSTIVDDGVRYDSTVIGGAPVRLSAPVARLREE